MKVMFIGDGAHDIGSPSFSPKPRTASGVISTLSRQLNPAISTESVAMSWTEIPRLNPSKRGLDHKLVAAKELAVKHGCQGTIAVVDQDRDASRIETLRQGQARIHEHRIAIGMAVESIEAWTLGDPQAIASTLGVSLADVCRHYNPSRVESYYENSGKEEHRPKGILERIAQLRHEKDSAAFRAAVAERTDIATLEKNCPKGFAPFAAEVRRVFPPT